MTARLYENLENSLKDFLDAQITSDSLVGDDGSSVMVRVGRKNDDDFRLPCITVYVESSTLDRFEIGSNLRDERILIIIDIYATNSGERLDLAKWLVETLEDGWQNYTYSYNASDPESPTKVVDDWVNVDFLTNTRVALSQNVSEIDANRHQVTISVWLS